MQIMRFYLLATAVVVSCSLFSCKDETKTTAAAGKPTVAAAPASKLPAANTTGLTELLDRYYELKNALVKTDTAQTSASASRLMSAAEELQHQLAGASQFPDLAASLQSLMQQSEAISNTVDPSCEKQRTIFNSASQSVMQVLAQSDYKSGAVYKQYCPMAFDDKGAFWFSSSEEIENPYLPKTMLHCGEVQDTL